MNQVAEGYFVVSPKPIIYVFSDNYLRGMFWETEYKAFARNQNVKAKAAAQAWPKFYSLLFTDGIQKAIVRPVRDQLELSGVGLVQLVILHGIKNDLDKFDALKVVRQYLEGNSLNNAQRYLEEIFTRLAGRADVGGSKVNYTLGCERAENAGFWAEVLKDATYSDNLPKSL